MTVNSPLTNTSECAPVTGQTGIWRYFFQPVDIASLVYFRIAFGAFMLWEVCYYYNRWVQRLWMDPEFHFTYYGFDWIRPWPGGGMYIHFLILGGLAVFIIFGLWYRVSISLFCLGFTYVFLLDQAQYRSHFYLICLISFLMIFIPAHRAFSVDAWHRPAIRSNTVPAWALGLLIAQVSIVYFYSGLAKVNGDWLRGEPIRMFFSQFDSPLIGGLSNEWLVYFFSYGGLLFDLLVVPLLLWKKTCPFAFAVAVAFHLTNVWMLNFRFFPWFMIAVTTLYLSPDWPRRLIGRCRSVSKQEQHKLDSSEESVSLQPRQRVVIALVGIYLAVQLFVPLRHYLYPGNASWTEEGHRFAWRLRLRSKDARAEFLVKDPVGNKALRINPLRYLADWQVREMSIHPNLILQFAHHVASEYHKKGYKRVEVYAAVQASLNGRKPQYLIDPKVDLAAQPLTLGHLPWIVPLTEPLPTRIQTKD